MNTVSLTRLLRLSAVPLIIGATILAPARATLLVYEGFNGYTVGALAPQTPNANTTGLDGSVGYYDGNGTRTAGYTIQSAGLTFGSLSTSGGSLKFTTTTNVIGADIEIGSTPFSGTLWGSYLINLSTNSTAASGGTVLRIGATPGDSPGAHFNSWADSRNTTTTNVAVGYGTGVSASADGASGLLLNTTYIIVSSFTNVGTPLDGTTTTGVATLWALTQTQFGSFLSAGGTQSALSTYASATATQTTTSGTLNFDSLSAFGIITQGDAGTIDEIRFGSTLADVTPIPEPAATAAAMGIGCALLLLYRRTRAGV